jgi:putative membrane protein
MSLLDVLPVANACLNLTATVLLVGGFVAIRTRRIELHRALMLSALVTSAVFLVGYLTRMALSGAHHFPDVGWPRTAYLALLASHTVLAAVALPMVLRTVWLGLRRRDGQHRRIARFTWPTWLYVSATGVAVYVMLYHVAPALVASR